MRIGKVRSIAASGDRVLCDVLVDGDVIQDAVLTYPLHVRARVVEGTRVKVWTLEGNDIDVMVEPFEFATASDLSIPSPGIAIATAGGTASPAATHADLEAHVNWAAAHIHPAGTPNTSAPLDPPPSPSGTQVMIAE